LIPVFEGVPVLHAWQAQPRAAQAVERWLFYLRSNIFNQKTVERPIKNFCT
jgi:hypothetical protein